MFCLQHFHKDFMNKWITLGSLINQEETVVKSLFQTNLRGALRQAETSKTLEKKHQHGTKVNYLDIFLIEYGSTILGKIF